MIPILSWSYRGVDKCIISTAQHARPNVIGQRDPCRAQLATASSVVLHNTRKFHVSHVRNYDTHSAYSTTLLLPSWLGNGTSVPMVFFIGGGAPGLPLTLAGPSARVGVASAGFFDDDEMNAAGPAARNVVRDGVGLTIHLRQNI
jgi:hypothetical protein